MDYNIVAAYSAEKKQWDIKVTGEVDIFCAEDFRKRIMAIFKEKPARLSIDCGGLLYLDSTAVAALLQVFKAVRGCGGDLTLVSAGPTLMRLLTITNLDKILTK